MGTLRKNTNSIPFEVAEWSDADSQDNALATATKAAETGKTHLITAISASFSTSSTSGLLQVKDGATVIWERYVHGAFDFDFSAKPLLTTKGNAVSAELAASGTLGVIGKVNLSGFTEEVRV